MDLNTKQRLLKVRELKKSQKPSFVRVESWRHKMVKPSWRKSRGIDSKTRRKTKNGVVSPDSGFQGPKKVRDLHPSGLEDILVFKIDDLKDLSPKKHAVRISAKIGTKKKLEIIEIARERNFRILNMGISKKELLDLEANEGEKGDEGEKSAKKKQIEDKKKSKTKNEEESEKSDESE